MSQSKPARTVVFEAVDVAYESLSAGQERFYRDHRFAEVFSSTRRCPNAVNPRMASIVGVAVVEKRLVYDVLLIVPGRYGGR